MVLSFFFLGLGDETAILVAFVLPILWSFTVYGQVPFQRLMPTASQQLRRGVGNWDSSPCIVEREKLRKAKAPPSQ